MAEGWMDKTKLAEENTQGEEEALHARDFDPEEFLISMGFGGSDSSMQRIPQRFVQQQSQARGVTVEAFLETQRKILNRFESGFSGYKGLAGSLDSHPSQVVENILQSMKSTNHEDNKSPSDAKLPGTSSVPSRFKLVNPKRKSLHSIVEQATQENNPKTQNMAGFKQAAKKVIQANKERDAFCGGTEAEDQTDKKR
eukprot:TRINITY_DN1432_c1_g1_i2.p1 TRINITY_DN1432_c1_g1~~TRINITY_DN1432_c1_g1_i2.p1  ORF type:complete len:197 (+),score=65.11 TRINITY_DN1432_c1_g1_i2:97-687(+)